MGRQPARRSLSQSPAGSPRVARPLNFTALARGVRAHLNQDRRYEHSVRVARCAELLAQHHGLDTARARLAGMLHDLARLYSAERLFDECGIRGLSVNEFERKHPIVLHARLGADIARERFGVKDAAVLSAIAKHTLGDAHMSPLDCAVYLANALEPGRDYPERAQLWDLACRDLDEAMRRTLAASLEHHARKGSDVAPQTAAAARAFGLPTKEAQTAGTY